MTMAKERPINGTAAIVQNPLGTHAAADATPHHDRWTASSRAQIGMMKSSPVTQTMVDLYP